MHQRNGATVDGNKPAQAERNKSVTRDEIANALCSGKCPPLKVLHAAVRENASLVSLRSRNSGVTAETVATVKRATIAAMGRSGVHTPFLNYCDELIQSAPPARLAQAAA